MPVSCWFEGEDEWGAHIYDEIPVPAEGDRKAKVAAMTQAMAWAFEHGISEHPEDWHMLQKVFVNDLDPERLARSRARTGTGNGPAPIVAVAKPAAALSPEPETGAEPPTATEHDSAPDDAPGDVEGTPS